MLDLQYSKVVQQKLRELKAYLVQVSGEKRGTKQLQELVASIENLASFPQTGIPISILYDVEPEFQKYYVLIRPKNYVIYYISEWQEIFINLLLLPNTDVILKLLCRAIRQFEQFKLFYVFSSITISFSNFV